jgi:GlpG protein
LLFLAFGFEFLKRQTSKQRKAAMNRRTPKAFYGFCCAGQGRRIVGITGFPRGRRRSPLSCILQFPDAANSRRGGRYSPAIEHSMRQIGTLSTKEDANRFADYLLTQGVEVKAEHEPPAWVIWVRDENHLDRAREELDQFTSNPGDERYREASRKAVNLRREEETRREQTRRNLHEMTEQWNRPLMQRRPLTMVLIALCLLVTFTSGFGKKPAIFGSLSYAGYRNVGGENVQTGYDAIQRGELWRLVTPIFIHFDFMHILFNSIAMFILGGMIEERRGTWRLGAMVLVLAVLSNVAQYEYSGSADFGGMSGVAYGLFGYLWMKTLFDPKSGFYLDATTVAMMLIWFVLGVTGQFKNIANAAHAGGLVVGIAMGYLPTLFRRERA